MSFQEISLLLPSQDQQLPCYGMVILRKTNHQLETLLVQTHQGHWGFPKGKRKFKKGETELQATLREVEEETGFSSDGLTILMDEEGHPVWLTENSKKGNPVIGLLIASPVDPSQELVYDPKELLEVSWHPVKEAMKYPEEQLYSKRKAVLQSAIEKCVGW